MVGRASHLKRDRHFCKSPKVRLKCEKEPDYFRYRAGDGDAIDDKFTCAFMIGIIDWHICNVLRTFEIH
jgi:hypothetical protein